MLGPNIWWQKLKVNFGAQLAGTVYHGAARVWGDGTLKCDIAGDLMEQKRDKGECRDPKGVRSSLCNFEILRKTGTA